MMLTRRSRGSSQLGPRLVVTATVVGLVVLGLGSPAANADTAPPAGTPATVSADALSTWQLNGVVWSQVSVGDIVYVAGSFSQARPPGVAVGGAGSVPATNLFAYDITTGLPVTFPHTADGPVKYITTSPDGKTLYIGGTFKSVDGQSRAHIAAFDITTSAGTLTGFAPVIDGPVAAIAVSQDNGTVYVGGSFNSIGMGKAASVRMNLAAFAAGSGSLSATWKPGTDGQVESIVVTPVGDRVIIGGQFYLLAGAPAYGMGAVLAKTGVSASWAAHNIIKVTNKIGATVYRNGGIDTLRTDGTYIYGGGWSNGVGAQFEGTFAANPADGSIVFLNDCRGDTYDVLPVGGVLYAASHSHSCQAIGGFPESRVPGNPLEYHLTAVTTIATGHNIALPPTPNERWSYAGQPSSTLLDWFPSLQPGTTTPQHQAAWSLAGSSDGKYISVGGEFTAVNGQPQQDLTRFAVSGSAPNKVGPTPTSVIAPTASSTTTGTANVTWRTAWDRDNTNLTYVLYRLNSLGTGRVQVTSTTQNSTFWQLRTTTYTDAGLTAGSIYRYQISAMDPFHNTIFSAMSGPVKIASGPGSVNSTFTATGPCRVFDTRSGAGTCAGAAKVAKVPLVAGSTLTVKVAGVAGVPTSATAVVLNITAVGATSPTFVTAWPAGKTRPTASNVNVHNANPTPNLAVVPVGANGSVSFYNLTGRVNLIADISGYFAPTTGSTFTTTGPCRVLDTRSTTGATCASSPNVPKASVAAGNTLTVKVTGVNGVPSTATAVVLNLTAVGGTKPTYVTAWPAGKTRPTVSNLNVSGTAPTPNLAVVPIGTNGSISLFNFAGNVNLIADISGFFAPTVSSWFASTGPCRLFDTRFGTGACAGGSTPVPREPVTAGGKLKVKVAGVGGVPSDATAVVVNLTAVGATKSTFITAWPGDPAALPTVSNLNVGGSAATSNLAVIPVSSDGYIELYNLSGSINLIGDLAGYFQP